jgi:hypothetical protein
VARIRAFLEFTWIGKSVRGGFYLHPSDEDLSLGTPLRKKPLCCGDFSLHQFEKCSRASEGVSAWRSDALEQYCLEECRGWDEVEGEMLGEAAGALLPVEEEAAVALGEADGGIDVEPGESVVDPGGGAFQLGVVANGGLVEDEVEAGIGREILGWMRWAGK